MKNRRVRSIALLPEHDAYMTALALAEFDGSRSAAFREVIKRYIAAKDASAFLNGTDMPKRRIVDAVSA